MCGLVVFLANGWSLKFQPLANLFMIFLFLAILATFAPGLAAALGVGVLVYLLLSLYPKLAKNL
jgi:hypothetical protein